MYRICMISDFFYPNSGGVESHIFQLSQCLINYGHKVVVLTHSYGCRKGIRIMSRGLKVYYLPFAVIYNQCTLPTLFASLPLIRSILIREQIDIVHCHSAFSAMAIESLIHGKLLGLKTIFTEHSLFGFADVSAIITNQLLGMSLIFANAVICVSHVGKENTALRAGVDPNKIYVIPNAVDTNVFKPDPSSRDSRYVTIIVASRLVYRKGIDLLIEAIPIICKQYPQTRFFIIGDGPKKVNLEQMVEENLLQSRVQMFGMVKHENIRDILIQGDIFLNSSLTEAFCMAIIEAVACGLQVVSTNVGGIPEVLPNDLIWLTEPTVEGLVEGVDRALDDLKKGQVLPPEVCYERIKTYYQWKEMTKRTLKVYERIVQDDIKPVGYYLSKLWKRGSICDLLMIYILIIEYLVLLFWSFILPNEKIDIALELPRFLK
ncbi:N-acetylglucosaminyl-phosphatidylinositol biosynthetic protein [Tetranychus urticae]|uniref:N-acetylglucosaminyl-phosphatidylinositol biosynthetic protein n=1 Tax=Tetranychus urticae TaxID=32264 RepID=UPI00077BB3F3|nr:N-acetylglucosaminyl-phosphatidylinositol biosynthetic protein [Tetranychus urticae]XP_015787299.1 N-acetylglucosaminyl-phosphatidylinositol biosynthetic protein [Tetranychus urticae]XP_015787300.1 N-acetylglucosaminyl-phosphatidylinositol biosynthetic protein [Tetranychus urticae]